MPNAPARPCRTPACPALVYDRSGYCPQHRIANRRAAEARRVRDYQHGGGNRPDWRALRAIILARDPICRLCGVSKSTTAEHRIPKRLGGKDDEANLRGACHSCSSRVTSKYDGGFGNKRRPGKP